MKGGPRKNVGQKARTNVAMLEFVVCHQLASESREIIL